MKSDIEDLRRETEAIEKRTKLFFIVVVMAIAGITITAIVLIAR